MSCSHVNVSVIRDGDDLVRKCDACGTELTRIIDYYKYMK